MKWVDRAAAIRSEGDFREDGSPNPWKLCTVTKMIRILPIWTTTIMFWCVHAQMITFSVQRAASMDRMIGDFQMPSASFNVFFIGGIMITLALYDSLIMKRYGGSKGLAISAIAMAAAAMEQKRLKVIRAKKKTPTTALPLTAFILVPQFAIVGIAEAFIYSGQLSSPKGMKAMSNSLFLTTIAFGYFVTTVLVGLVKKITAGKDGKPWLASKINDSRLDYIRLDYFYATIINFGVYLVYATWYEPNSSDPDHDHDHDEERQPCDVE